MLEGLKLRKKLGENWKKVDCEAVETYGLRVIQGEKTKNFYMLKENELLNEPDGSRRALAYEVSRGKEYVVIATGNKVFVKYPGDGDMAEIIELRDMHSIYQIDNIAMLFQKNNNNQIYKVLDINKLQVKDIDLFCYFWVNEMSVIGLIEDGGYRYMYSQNNQLYTTDILEKNLEDEQGCQISKKKGEKGYRLYYLSPNLGILESTEIWDEIRKVPYRERKKYYPYDFIAQKDGRTFLIKGFPEDMIEKENFFCKIKIVGDDI